MTSTGSGSKTDALIVFVTGIGQSFSYLFDRAYLASGAFSAGTLQDYENYAPLIEAGKELDSWNIFAFRAKEGLGTRTGRRALVKTAAALFGSAVMRRNLLREKTARQLVGAFFSLNKLDAKGDADPRVVTPRYPGPFSSYPGAADENGVLRSRAKARFYRSVPCEAIARKALGETFEDYLYCFNYRPCSLTSPISYPPAPYISLSSSPYRIPIQPEPGQTKRISSSSLAFIFLPSRPSSMRTGTPFTHSPLPPGA